MADFSIPFASDAEKRLATNDEKQNGFPCGAASQPLFNGLFHQLWSEFNAIHQAGGIAGSDTEVNTTLLNIQALIDAATGGADTSQYILLSQVRSRLPIFPEFLTPDGKINVNAPATGTIRIPGGIDFLHRGIFTVSTVETDFNTGISKIYHLRWNSVDGFTLNDLASTTYNPSSFAENHSSFDSSYDDMLISRVITNSSNVATITNLINKHQMWENDRTTYTGSIPSQSSDGTIAFVIEVDLSFSRTPKFRSGLPHVGATSTAGTRGLDGNANQLVYNVIDRYGVEFRVSSDFEGSGVSGFYASVEWSMGA